MRSDDRAFLTYYAWQVFVLTPDGVERLTGPGTAVSDRYETIGRSYAGTRREDPRIAPRITRRSATRAAS